MKITIEMDENCIEEEVVIRCREMNEDILKIQKGVYVSRSYYKPLKSKIEETRRI